MLRISGLAGLFVALSAAAPFQLTIPASFCERLAPQLGMKPNLKASSKVRAGGWNVNLARGLGPALFGGSFTASFSLKPVDENSLSEHQRMENACEMTAKGVICKIDGPARLSVGTKKGKITTDALSGERAVVEMRSSVISCHDE